MRWSWISKTASSRCVSCREDTITAGRDISITTCQPLPPRYPPLPLHPFRPPRHTRRPRPPQQPRPLPRPLINKLCIHEEASGFQVLSMTFPFSLFPEREKPRGSGASSPRPDRGERSGCRVRRIHSNSASQRFLINSYRCERVPRCRMRACGYVGQRPCCRGRPGSGQHDFSLLRPAKNRTLHPA